MLDSNARKYVQPLLDAVARGARRLGVSANAMTVGGMLVGVAAAVLVALGHPVAGFLVLWLSGLIDAADGTLARLTNSSSPLGAILDITFDRVVELSMITAPTRQPASFGGKCSRMMIAYDGTMPPWNRPNRPEIT